MEHPDVSVVGLGPMGHPIAHNLLAAHRTVAVWNRTQSRGDDLVAAGAQRAKTLEEAAAPVILSVLPDVHHLRGLLTPSVKAAWARAGARLVVLSTTGPDQLTALAAELDVDGIRVVDAPVSGGVAGAKAGRLSIMVGGAADDVTAVRGALESIGETVVHLGPLGSGATAKLCNQVVVAGTLASLGEALGLARRSGLDVEALLPLLEGGLARSEVLAQKKHNLIARDYPLGGSTANQVKDLLYAAEAAGSVELRARLIPVLMGMFEDAVQAGHGEADHAAVQEVFLNADE
ncbi:NAD(P)-dependent oxidoreductase [Brachybacterium sp. GCM10030267]|uniref:NAD(P)-dependent oxidoreductase n=1 Tax=unclassified Brachybacterium TaxID=2623841 RepID=UPI0036236E39